MSDPADRQPVGDCGWCGKPAFTRLFASGTPRTKNPVLVPVCDDHEAHFLAQGAVSERSEFNRKHGFERP